MSPSAEPCPCALRRLPRRRRPVSGWRWRRCSPHRSPPSRRLASHLVALLTAASLASGWRESVAAARPYARLFVLLALISAWSAITALWSRIPGHSLLESGRFLLLNAGGIVVLGRTAGLGDGKADRLVWLTLSSPV
jgi:hypothetical protein